MVELEADTRGAFVAYLRRNFALHPSTAQLVVLVGSPRTESNELAQFW